MIGPAILAAVGFAPLFLAAGISAGLRKRRTDRLAAVLAAVGFAVLLGSGSWATVIAGAAWWMFPSCVGGIAVMVGFLPFGRWLGDRLDRGPR